MGMHNGEYYLSNSEMTDWEQMCPLVWKAKHIDGKFSKDQSEAMMYGSWFETLAIGSGVKGQIIEPTAKMLNSAYADRVKAQAADCRSYLKKLGGKVITKQEYIYTTIVDEDGQVIKVCGGLDIRYQMQDNSPLIIDLKFTGDNDNDFGPYQFGNPEKINPTQGVHYKMLHKANYGTDALFEWWIFDKSPSVKQKRIGLEVSEVSQAIHIEKCSRIYNEITFAMQMDDWGFNNSFDNCRICPVKCKHERVLPEVHQITV